MRIVTVSPKGQITIPVKDRERFKECKQFLFEVKGTTIILKPIKIEVIGSTDDLENFSALAASSFDFWDNADDDIYDDFYN